MKGKDVLYGHGHERVRKQKRTDFLLDAGWVIRLSEVR